MPHTIKTAAVQMDATPAPLTERLARAADLVAEAASSGAELIVLPELFNCGYHYHDDNFAAAEPMDGPTVTWMRDQAAQQRVHLVGTLLVRDGDDVFNRALLFAPDGRMWRYDKQYPFAWERAYFREGQGITVADTDLGKLGLMICWDSAHTELWDRYAGEVQAMVIPSCPPLVGSLEVVFPDGQRVTSDVRAISPRSGKESVFGKDLDRRAAWMGVPVVNTGGSGRFRSHVPAPRISLAGLLVRRPDLWKRIQEAQQVMVETAYYAETKIVSAGGKVVARVERDGDAFTLGTMELPDAPPARQRSRQPRTTLMPAVTFFLDHLATAVVIPTYRAGVRRQFGGHMAPYDVRTLVWAGVATGAAMIGWLLGRLSD